jgi:hypothetical protein
LPSILLRQPSPVKSREPGDRLPTLDPGSSNIDGPGRAAAEAPAAALVRTVAVVVTGELSQDIAQMLLAEDQHLV